MDDSYGRIEYERRFLVDPGSDWRDAAKSFAKRIDDRYIQGSRLRLRRMVDEPDRRVVHKLNRKSRSDSSYSRSINRILLDDSEYALLMTLPADVLTKTRYFVESDDRVFGVDVFEGELSGLVLCEVEAAGLEELMGIPRPPFSVREVTEDAFFEGGCLCRASPAQLRLRLDELGVPPP